MVTLAILACGGDPAQPTVVPEPATEPSAPASADSELPPTARADLVKQLRNDLAAVRSPSDGGGRAWIAEGPKTVEAGSINSWRLVYEAGPLGIAVGGTLLLQAPPFWGWSTPQAESERAEGYVGVSGPDGVRLVPTNPDKLMLALRVEGRALAAGEQVTIDWTTRVDRFAEHGEAIWFAVDGDGDGVRKVMPDPPTVDVVAQPAVGLLVTLPSVAAPGERVRLTVASLDRLGNAFHDLSGDVEVALPFPTETVQMKDGLAEVWFTPDRPGLFTAFARGPDDLEGSSNPMLVRKGAPKVYWGDLQIHTTLSDGTGSLDDSYRYARDVARLDVAAVTDHDHWGMQFLDANPAMWTQMQAATTRWSNDQFIAVLGYEWTNWVHGHRHVLYFGDPGPVITSVDPATDDPDELWAALREQPEGVQSGALTIAHHSAGGPVAVNWDFAPDPVFEPVTELCSVHGSSEAADTPARIYDAVPGNYVRDQLVRGYQLGLLCSTDGHDGHPGMGHLYGGKGGVAGIVADARTPEAILAAIKAKRVYGTNGVRSILRFAANGKPMGTTLPVGPVELMVRYIGTAPVVRVDLVTQSGLSSTDVEAEGVLHRTWKMEPTGPGFVYARVIQQDGGAAWSSPIWFE